MKPSQLNSLLVILFALSGVPERLQGQDFTLFEPVEASASPDAQARPGREARATNAAPEFTLVGSSRFGDRVSVILGHRDGRRIVVRTGVGNTVAVPEYTNYRVVVTDAGEVSLTLPPGEPCIEFPDSGVSCNPGGDIAQLSLPTRPAVASNSRQTTVTETIQGTDAGSVEVVEDPGNPFAQMRARALNGEEQGNASNDSGRGARFTPRRIPPSEVPPGQRVVSTPFGDRLVPL